MGEWIVKTKLIEILCLYLDYDVWIPSETRTKREKHFAKRVISMHDIENG